MLVTWLATAALIYFCEDQIVLGGDLVPSHHLLLEIDGEIFLDPPPEKSGPARVFYLQPSKNELLGPTKPEWVILSEQENLHDLFSDMLDLVCAEHPALNKLKLLAALDQREAEFSSLIGYQISLPHVYCKETREPLMIVAKAMGHLASPVGGEPISTIFMIISPKDQPEVHLEQISKVAKFISKEKNRFALAAAKDEAELFYALERG